MLHSQIEKDASDVCTIAAQEAELFSDFYIPEKLSYYVLKYSNRLLDPVPLVLIVAGQSNGVGTNEFVISETLLNYKAEIVRSLGSSFRNLHHRNYGDSIVWYGLPCAYELLKRFPNKMIYVIGAGSSGASIMTRNYSPISNTWAAVGKCRSRALNIIKPILDSLPNYRIVGTLWLQGETDVSNLYIDNLSSIEDFRFSVKDIINWFLWRFGGYFFASTIAYWFYANEALDRYVDIVNDEYAKAISSIPRAYVATSINRTFRGTNIRYQDSDLWRDTIHYSQKGYDIIGKEFANYVANFI